MVQSVSSYSNVNPTSGTGDVKADIAVKLFKEAQESQQLVGSIIEDTAEISQEAMQKYQAERC